MDEMNEKLKVFRLSLKKWLRANSKNYDKTDRTSTLYDERTKTMCCLGMFARQCGLPPRALKDATSPEEVNDNWLNSNPEFAKLVKGPAHRDSVLVDKAIGINDDEETTDEEKIEKLRPLFRKLGYRIEVTS